MGLKEDPQFEMDPAKKMSHFRPKRSKKSVQYFTADGRK